MKTKYTDAHMHFPKDKQQTEKALAIMKQKGVRTLAVSTDIPSYCQIRELSKAEECLDISFGIHPNEAEKYEKRLEEILPYLDEAPRIGEIGLCKYWAKNREAQKKVFDYQIEYAAKAGKTVNIHTAGYEWEVVETLKKHMPPAVLIHWYSGSLEAFYELNAMGCYFSFGVNLIARSMGTPCSSLDPLDPVKSDIPVTRKMIPFVKPNRILTETDGPEAGQWVNGKLSYADVIPLIVRKLSELSDTDQCEMRRQISENYSRFIALL